MKSISEIRTEFEACRGSRAELYEMYAYDTRMGVQKLIQKYQKQDEKLANERLRLKQMRQYEEKYSHCDYICGIDEVGRGPLAGPVVAAAVILPKDAEILYLNDSTALQAGSSIASPPLRRRSIRYYGLHTPAGHLLGAESHCGRYHAFPGSALLAGRIHRTAFRRFGKQRRQQQTGGCYAGRWRFDCVDRAFSVPPFRF